MTEDKKIARQRRSTVHYASAVNPSSTAISRETNEPGSRVIRPKKNRTGKRKNRASPDGTNGTTVFPEGARGAGHAARSLYFSRRRGTGTVEPVPPAHGSARRFALNFDAKKRLTELYMVMMIGDILFRNLFL